MKTRILKIGALQVAFCTICFALWADQDAPTAVQTKQDLGVAPARSANLSPWAAQIAKLAEARISEDVMLSFVDSAGTFNLTAEQIITLSESGVSGSVVNAMIRHDAEIIAGCRQVVASTVPDTGAPLVTFSTSSVPEHSPMMTPDPEPGDSIQEPPAEIASLPEWVYSPCLARKDAPEGHELSPVRKPYAVQLTDPIIVYPGYGRTANIQFLQMFP